MVGDVDRLTGLLSDRRSFSMSDETVSKIFLYIGNLPRLKELSGIELVDAVLKEFPDASQEEMVAAIKSAIALIEANAHMAGAKDLRAAIDRMAKKFGERK